jgi:ubiquitin-like 1-activating enzyme E1 B
MTAISTQPKDTTTECHSSGILKALSLSIGSDIVQQILNCKIILVGSGGIGCELLKNLAFCGFRTVKVIDLDTIDVSNLNRQLLFRSNHVGLPKCTVACQVATKLAHQTIGNTITNNTTTSTSATDIPPIEYLAYHGNICDNTTFNVPFFQNEADIVLNALDNVVARRRVNRLCLAAGVPLVEAGTTGYLGQVRTIHKDTSVACYECKTQETAKVYPICTIRSTPSAPVHTIVWSKELYNLLFGPNIETSMLYEDDESTTTEEDKSTYMKSVIEYRSLIFPDNNGAENIDKHVNSIVESAQRLAITIITSLFVDEINKQLNMDRYKTSMKKPVPLDINQHYLTDPNSVPAIIAPSKKIDTYKQTDIWNQQECVAEFVDCLVDAATTAASAASTDGEKDSNNDNNNPDIVTPILPSFDKDDSLSMRFVTAASNLRNYVFNIEPIQSYYSAKGIAGT